MFERLVYVSRAAAHLGPREVYDITRKAHNRNSELGLTGALVHLDGYFLQVLEGEGFRLRERFALIAADPRHTDVTLRHTDTLADRSFAGEWMALRLDADVPPEVLARHAYRPGFPADRFDGARLLAFVQDCCTAAESASAR